MKWRPETLEEYHERMRLFRAAKESFEFYDTGLGALLPDAGQQKQKAMAAMWEYCNAPARDGS